MDTASAAGAGDSLQSSLFAGHTAVTPTGDTLREIGGGMVDTTYSAREFRNNEIGYLIVSQEHGHKPDGNPIWRVVTNVALPPMDSTQHLMFGGMCGINYKSDPYVFAVVGIGGDSVYRNIRRAWRFDRATETLRTIPTTKVVCWDPGDD